MPVNTYTLNFTPLLRSFSAMTTTVTTTAEAFIRATAARIPARNTAGNYRLDGPGYYVTIDLTPEGYRKFTTLGDAVDYGKTLYGFTTMPKVEVYERTKAYPVAVITGDRSNPEVTYP